MTLFSSKMMPDVASLLAVDNIKKLKKCVNSEARLLHEWLISNKLTLNLKKNEVYALCKHKCYFSKSKKKV